MPDKIMRLALVCLIGGLFLPISSCSQKPLMSSVESVSLEVDFEYFLIRNISDLNSLEIIKKDIAIYDKIYSHIEKGKGFVFLTNGYKITDQFPYKGMIYLSSEHGSSGVVYANFFKGELGTPYKFASPK